MTEEQLTDSTDTSEADAIISEEQRLAKVPAELRAASWKPGQSGNPSGRPSKLKTLTGMLESKVNREEMAAKLIAIATNDETPALQLEAIKYIYARIEGNPIQAMRHQIEGAVGPLIFLHPGKVDSETNTAESETLDTIEGEVLDDAKDSDTSSDPAGPPSV